MKDPLAALDEELAQLQATQANVGDGATALRKQRAVLTREQLESQLKRSVERIEQVKAQAGQLQHRLTQLRLHEGASDLVDHEARWLRNEIAKKVTELEALMARAKEEAAVARPKIRWCLHVEAGLSDEEADALAREPVPSRPQPEGEVVHIVDEERAHDHR